MNMLGVLGNPTQEGLDSDVLHQDLSSKASLSQVEKVYSDFHKEMKAVEAAVRPMPMKVREQDNFFLGGGGPNSKKCTYIRKKSPRNLANQQKKVSGRWICWKTHQCAPFFGWFQTLTSFTNVNWTSHRLRAPRVPKWTATPRSANGSSRYPKRFMRNGNLGWVWELDPSKPMVTRVYPPWNEQLAPWKWMVGRRSFLFGGMAYVHGLLLVWGGV